MTLRVIGPTEENVALLRKDWAKRVAALLQKSSGPRDTAAIVADYVDRSPYNLSSLVVLATSGRKRMLLTGDGRGDHTLSELEQAGLISRGRLSVDLLKLPHHGSSRNVDQNYFDTIQARHYVISADGNYSNPDVETLEMIAKSRRDDEFTIHLTYPYREWHDRAVARQVEQFFTAEKARGRNYRVVTRAPGDASLNVTL